MNENNAWLLASVAAAFLAIAETAKAFDELSKGEL